MSNSQFLISDSTQLRLQNGNQGTGKVIVSNANGQMDWSTYDANMGFAYRSHVVALNGGSTVVNLLSQSHYMVVNNQGSANNSTNKVRLVLPTSPALYDIVRITLMSEPWEVYVSSTNKLIRLSAYDATSSTYPPTPRNKGNASLGTFTQNQWLRLNPHCTYEITYFTNTGPLGELSYDSWYLTSVAGYDNDRGG